MLLSTIPVPKSFNNKLYETAGTTRENGYCHLLVINGNNSCYVADGAGEAEQLVDKAPELGLGEDERLKDAAEDQRRAVAQVFSSKDLSDLKNAIESLGKGDKDEIEILGIKKELQEYEEDIEDLKFLKAEAGKFDLHESKGAKRLFSMVNRVLGRVDGLVQSLEEKERQIVIAVATNSFMFK